MKVAIISASAERGGAERSLLTFLKVAHGKTIEAVVLLPKAGPLAGLLSGLGVPWQVIPMPPPLMSQSRQNGGHVLRRMLSLSFQGSVYLVSLAQAIRKLKPEVIYTNGLKSNLIGTAVGKMIRRKVTWHLRDDWGCSLLGLLADRGPRSIIANSQAAARTLQKYMQKPEKVTVIHNAVDLEEFSPEGPGVDWGELEQFKFKVGLPAAFARIKGQTLLMEAIEPIRRELPSTGFFFIGGSIYDTVGDRGYEDEIRGIVKEQGLAESVIFTGFHSEMAPWYRAMDVVVNASLVPESFGRTLLEAMACGTAVVGPKAGGIPEFVRHGDNGLLYEPGNKEALAAAVLTLLRNPGLRRRLGEQGLQTAAQFAPEPQAEAILGVLSRVKN
jgi:glycosyltransferase involved in cell wall biosynthesis